MLELLAPAGSMESLRAAVQNGANAVYLGCGIYNARQGAKNFTPQALTEAVKYCHVRDVAVHLTLNTLVSDKETQELVQLIRHAAQSGVDAFIVQDLGVVRLCRQIAPHIPIHGSTQMTIHSLPGVLLCAAWGLSRVVLSRELSREEIRYICQNSPIEIEVFGHGALCMCYSGQCYLSAAIGGRSGNRGRCAQPCRQSYGYGRWQNQYPLSLKDSCLVRELKELEQMGVASLKLEGRMKRPEYVAAVTGIYRKALDTHMVTRDMEKTLLDAFNRQGFTQGYYDGILGGEMFGVREDTRENAALFKELRQTYETGETPLVPIRFQAVVRPGLTQLTVIDPQNRVCTAQGPAPEMARVAELTKEVLIARLTKTGGTPYRCVEAAVEIEPGLSLSASAINGLRRDVLNQLTALRARRDVPALGRPERIPNYRTPQEPPAYNIQVTTKEQITGRLLKMQPNLLYVPLHLLTEDAAFTRDLVGKVRVCPVLPRVVHDGELARLKDQLRSLRALGIREALVGNLGLLLPVRECGMHPRGDFGLNIYNSAALQSIREMELRSQCLSFEMTLPQIRDAQKGLPCEILAYGRLPLMITENCLIRGRTGQCTCHLGSAKLVDKTGSEFPVIRDGNTCRSVLLNGKKLYWLDRQEDLARLGLWAVRLYFTTENPQEVDRVLSACRSGEAMDPGACTRGLYLRGLQ
ncbi:MAG TPA: U32 family peptidase [Candidatus Faecousia excrementigallinarum]|uniref:U32 family peptidase n=1 Tax=Candidatus Faecousia excrementigallinarum TaxID=2840806 RepID=A0A9D0Z451_9FIRM|nr:U32 family peptidase [Candidatus Faecousia excrementigallinarum]